MNITSSVIKQIIGGPSDFGIGWLVILTSSIITILIAFVGFLKWFDEKVRKKWHLLKTISRLTIGTSIENFKALLGNSVFINEIGNYDEFIFINPYFLFLPLHNNFPDQF